MEINDITEIITNCSYRNIIDKIPDDIYDKKVIVETFEEIIDELLSKIASSSEFFMVNISGVPGSGKSTYTKMLLDGRACKEPDCSNALYISFDEIMEDSRLPFLSEAKTSPQKAFERWELPARIAGYELLKRAIEKKVNILFEHSSAIIIEESSGIKKPHIELFKYILSKKYKIHFRYIFVSDNEAQRRVIKRAQKTGRIVPDGYIEKRIEILNLLRPEYKELCTTYKQIEQCELKLS